MKLPPLYEIEFWKIGSIIRAWDPEGLLRMGAPLDEYDPEILTLACSGYRCTDVESTARVIAELFSCQFGHRTSRYTPEGVREIAEKVWEVYQAQTGPDFL